MSYNIIAHMANDEPVEGEIDELPLSNASFIAIKNPRRSNNRELDWLDSRTMTLLVPFSHLISLEIATPHDEDDHITKYRGSSSR